MRDVMHHVMHYFMHQAVLRVLYSYLLAKPRRELTKQEVLIVHCIVHCTVHCIVHCMVHCMVHCIVHCIVHCVVHCTGHCVVHCTGHYMVHCTGHYMVHYTGAHLRGVHRLGQRQRGGTRHHDVLPAVLRIRQLRVPAAGKGVESPLYYASPTLFLPSIYPLLPTFYTLTGSPTLLLPSFYPPSTLLLPRFYPRSPPLLQDILKEPNWRPRFRFYPPLVSFCGLARCPFTLTPT